MQLAIIGCGFVCDLYLRTLPNHPELSLVGVFDRATERADAVGAALGVEVYESLQAVLDDRRVDLVINLTNPSSHFEITRACLEAGKHVYSEKPLAMQMDQARELVRLAESRGLGLASAPCNVLGEAAQTVWSLLRKRAIGDVALVYAELDDGMVHRTFYSACLNEFRTPWPSQDEFETGCTIEHAGYFLSWLFAFFGPAVAVTAYSATLIGDKGTAVPLRRNAPDFSVACIELSNGVVARLTNSIVAMRDHSLTVFGQGGALRVENGWSYDSPIWLRRRQRGSLSAPELQPLVRPATWEHRYRTTPGIFMDYARGVNELASSISERRPCRIGARFSLHVNEVALAIQNAGREGTTIKIESSFDPIEPMPWAHG
jgi:predicted dehydrogenase